MISKLVSIGPSAGIKIFKPIVSVQQSISLIGMLLFLEFE